MSHARSEYKDFKALAPDAYEIVARARQAAAKAGIDKPLLELIKLRASQINGCAFCVQFHILQAEGSACPSTSSTSSWSGARRRFSSRERAALAWTEALTLLTEGVSDEVYAQARPNFPRRN